ncbi:hypothetical protein B0H14DRAFT_3079604 [Mycena olivaceomarginata]|nr:hypothetical protein B0H14DRAFT_3079604 [Mycena olivaceomarginata]
MSFLFTFKLPVPGLNPFSSPAQSPSEHPPTSDMLNLRRPSPAAPLSRKRGWDPSLAEPSQSAATLASSSGYLDTPAKYREMADEFELEDMAASTAVSAALIGTAVGLTVYRLWRDRGKEAEPEPEPDQQLPPPPSGLLPVHRPPSDTAAVFGHASSLEHFRPPSSTPPRTPYGSNNMEDDDAAVVEDKMDWLGDQLSLLIQEGQKALGREIVDEVDDGCGVWEEEDAGGFDAAEFGGGPSSSYQNSMSMSRSASPRQRKRPRNLTLAPPACAARPASESPRAARPASESPRAARFEFATSASLPASATRWRADAPEEEAYESPELKESMARARARLLGMRGAG